VLGRLVEQVGHALRAFERQLGLLPRVEVLGAAERLLALAPPAEGEGRGAEQAGDQVEEVEG
jgi:hypothetical protein